MRFSTFDYQADRKLRYVQCASGAAYKKKPANVNSRAFILW